MEVCLHECIVFIKMYAHILLPPSFVMDGYKRFKATGRSVINSAVVEGSVNRETGF